MIKNTANSLSTAYEKAVLPGRVITVAGSFPVKWSLPVQESRAITQELSLQFDSLHEVSLFPVALLVVAV